jgi:hypothetical protein
MELIDYMGHVESVLSDFQMRIGALETAVTAIPQLTLPTDPSASQVVVPDYSAQVTPVAAPMLAAV